MAFPFSLRQHGTKSSGGEWTEQEKWAVFTKARTVLGQNPNFVRMDACGALMRWDLYGNISPNSLGWEIDHIHPVSRGGTDFIENLQPLQWENNRAKGDGPLRCVVPRR